MQSQEEAFIMKKSNRILAALSSVAFSVGILIGAITIVCLYFPLKGYPKFGIDFVTSLELYTIIFDFLQTDLDIFIQYTCLGVLVIGVILALVWLILGLARKHFIEILFFFLTLVCFAYFSYICLYGISYVFAYIDTAATIEVIPLIKKILITADYLLPLVLIIITFAFDMKRIFSKEDAPEFVESPNYTSHALFEEMFPSEKEDQFVISEEERARIEKILLAEAEKALEEEKRRGPVDPRDVPPILYEEEPEPEIPPILYEPEPEPEELRPEDLPPVLFEEDEPVEEELRPEDLPPILFEPEPEEEPYEEEPLPDPLPACLYETEEEEEPLPDPLPACLIREKDDFEPLPFMIQGFVNREEQAQFPAREPFEGGTYVPAPKQEEPEERLPMFDEAPAYYEEPAPAAAPAPKSNGKAYHISHKKDVGYIVKPAGEKVIEATLPSEEEAIDYVRYYYPGSSIRIHDKNGKIRTI